MFDGFIYRFTRYEGQTVEIVGVMTVDAEGMTTSSRGDFDWHRVDPARYSVIRRGNAYYAIMPLDGHIFIFKLMVRGPDMPLICRNCL